MDRRVILPPGAVLRITVPATSANLGPGFDSLALALGLYNTLEFCVEPPYARTTIDITGEGHDSLSLDGENLVLVAMDRLARAVDLPLPPFALRMHNAIPLGRGLGSSAAAIVGGLLGAAILLGVKHDPTYLLAVGLDLEGHPDNIVAALYGGFTIGVTSGETAVTHRIQPPSALRAVLLVPDQFASTNESRATLPAAVSRADAVFNAGRTALLVAALAENRLDLLRVAMEDRLHQQYRGAVFQYLGAAIDAALDAGAHGASLSGAGSSVIALASDGCERIAAVMLGVARDYGLRAHTDILTPDMTGASYAIDALPARAMTLELHAHDSGEIGNGSARG